MQGWTYQVPQLGCVAHPVSHSYLNPTYLVLFHFTTTSVILLGNTAVFVYETTQNVIDVINALRNSFNVQTDQTISDLPVTSQRNEPDMGNDESKQVNRNDPKYIISEDPQVWVNWLWLVVLFIFAVT